MGFLTRIYGTFTIMLQNLFKMFYLHKNVLLQVFESSLKNLNNETTNIGSRLKTTKTDSAMNCLVSTNCYSIKTNGTDYFSYSSSEFSMRSSGTKLCDENDCDLLKCIYLIYCINLKYFRLF